MDSQYGSRQAARDLLRHFVAEWKKQILLATGDRWSTLRQELSKGLWSLKNVNAKGLVTVSRFRNLQSCELS